MGKNKKRKHALFHATRKQEDTIAETHVASAEDPSDISGPNLETAVSTLQALGQNPELLHSKRFKDLRRALHPFIVMQMKSYAQGTDYRNKVTLHLQHKKWADALSALRGCHDFEQKPKQGTIQRWVRDCDQAGDCKISLLNAILQIDGSSSNNKHDAGIVLAGEMSTQVDNLLLLDNWKIPAEDLDVEQSGEDPPAIESPSLESKIIYQEEASTRKPPNKYDLYLHTTAPGAIRWSNQVRPIGKHPVPFLDGAFALSHVMTTSECTQLRLAAEHLGFRPDHPTSLEAPTGIDSCEWLVDDSIMSVLNSRVKSHLPESIQGSRVHSINTRWRFFRYSQDCVYRPHLDGSWPESRINDKGEYECDEDGVVKSYLTFLVYLNDDFQGGETRFYLPSDKGMTARGVVPKEGSVLVFPQGNTASLIHEGSAVTKGTKYVIRTDVLYRTHPED